VANPSAASASAFTNNDSPSEITHRRPSPRLAAGDDDAFISNPDTLVGNLR
jgi:hypothetical protein